MEIPYSERKECMRPGDLRVTAGLEEDLSSTGSNQLLNLLYYNILYIINDPSLYSRCTDLKVLVGQVNLQPQRVDSLWEWPRLQLSQREGVLTEPGQHVLHQDDLVTHLRLLQAEERTLCEV